ncbi:sensor histidine kinase [Buchananella hordeovulneris]|uniref:sensor histidine kinase n=1 Tax=Buchananella hordeovulneris TaxID=52770 RepID=UPI0026DD43F2|nr:histidine kinase [Buchananella hordeovulneris]MDO5080608.1 histidine kinase [Buchananella hordeovulneris]
MSRRHDVLLALGIALISSLGALLPDPLLHTVSHSHVKRETVSGLLALEGLALIWWRTRPLLAQGLIFPLHLAVVSLLPLEIHLSGIAQALVAFSLGRRLPLRRAATITSSLATLTLLVTVLAKHPTWLDTAHLLLNQAFDFLLPLVGGAMLASRARHEQAVRQLAAAEQDKQLATALAEERRRLASELHDVAAHHLAGLVVQAAALERLIDRDPARAKEAAKHLRGMGKEALTGLRAVVKLLRHDDPQRGLADIPDLVATTRQLGVTITLDQAQTPLLPPLSDAAAYRIAQQAISNAIQHAPGAPIHVEVAGNGLRVRNARGQGEVGLGSGGVGLEVMRERAAAIRAILDVGPTDTGGWQVQLTWPHPSEEES